MIPKKIHYCWFGRNPLPESVRMCIASWRKYLSDYEIIEWNEDNFDVNSIPYTAQAYEAKKYAFVSDYARFCIIRDNGGIYFDTDVEVIKPFDDILQNGGYMGYENEDEVNPGLGFAAERGNPVIQRITEYYEGLKGFYVSGNRESVMTVVQHTTRVLREYGCNLGNNRQMSIANITIYPKDWFNPMDSLTGRLYITPNSHSIHRYDNSWGLQSRTRTVLVRFMHRFIGLQLSSFVKKILRGL